MRLIVAIAVLMCFLLSCDNDIDVVADYKTIPVVYGFIDNESDTNFVRIEKAFLGEGENANEVAQNPDSLYFDNIDVSLTKSNGTQIALNRIDGAQIGRPRDAGVFADRPNYLYYFTEDQISLRDDDRVTLAIQENDRAIAEATTPMLGGTQLTSPIYDQDRPINFIEGDETRIGFKYSSAAGMYGIRIHFSFLEENDQGVFVPKTVTWNVTDSGILTDGEVRRTHRIDGGNFFRFLAAELDGGNNIQRVSQSLDLELILAGKELRTIRDIQLANQGITGSQELPVYTNIENGRGIFTGKSTFVQKGINLAPRTLDSLVNGRITADLNFIN